MNKKKVFYLAIIIPISVFASKNLFAKLVESDDNIARMEKLKEKEEYNYSEEEIRKELQKDIVLTEDDKILEKEINAKEVEAEAEENKVLEIVKKYLPQEMNNILNKLGDKSIYDENKELEIEFDNLVLDIIESKNITKEENEILIDHMYLEYGNVKDVPELIERIEKVWDRKSVV